MKFNKIFEGIPYGKLKQQQNKPQYTKKEIKSIEK